MNDTGGRFGSASTPQTPGNPLADQLGEEENASLVLEDGEWLDVQRQTIYTYFLRQDARWSDGTPYTTRDLEFAYAVINNPFVDGESLRVYYQDLIECAALDDHTIRMKYRKQYFKSFEFTAGMASYGPPFHVFSEFFNADNKELTLEDLTPEEEAAAGKISASGQQFGKFYRTLACGMDSTDQDLFTTIFVQNFKGSLCRTARRGNAPAKFCW